MSENQQPDRPETEDRRPDEGPDTTELEQDPAYNPDDERLEQIKGG